MNVANEINDIIQEAKELTIELSRNTRNELLTNDFVTATEKAIDGAAKYIIKAMPVPDAVKDVLIDIKDSLKTRNLKDILNTAVKSTVREGLEMLGVSEKTLESLQEIKEAATKGGLVTAVKNGLQIVANNFLKNNIVGDYVYTFFGKLEAYVMNRDFMKKIEQIITKLEKKKEEFSKNCEEWYKAYRKLDISKMNEISEKLNENTYITSRYEECLKENKLIQNMTAMVNSTKQALSYNQQNLCEVL